MTANLPNFTLSDAVLGPCGRVAVEELVAERVDGILWVAKDV